MKILICDFVTFIKLPSMGPLSRLTLEGNTSEGGWTMTGTAVGVQARKGSLAVLIPWSNVRHCLIDPSEPKAKAS